MVLQLRVFGLPPAIGDVADRLSALPGARYVTRTDCAGLVLGRHGLVRRAFAALAVGLGTAALVAAVLTATLDLLDLLPASFSVGASALNGLTTVNRSTVVVAFAAGVAGMLSIESRASAAVGVAISVTTIPASAYLGVAAGVGELEKVFDTTGPVTPRRKVRPRGSGVIGALSC